MENSMSEDSLNKLEELPLEYFLSRHEHEPRELTIYFDGSAIRTYGSQQNSIYRGGKKYSQTQYFPLLAATKEGHLLLAKLRSGNVSDATSLAEITKLVEAILERYRM
ncbi:MAG: transposase [Candidatus Obscuribacter sp.]|nr:transposase [Candidatus Obscuribacter sp.]